MNFLITLVISTDNEFIISRGVSCEYALKQSDTALIDKLFKILSKINISDMNIEIVYTEYNFK